ncbi:MAG: prepilin-type N-terminal cleavage/methylation domain-containing protein [Patescibacteria group bacterium]
MTVLQPVKKVGNLHHYKKRNAGFTIIETIVAIAILAVAVVAPLSLAQRSLNADIYARDQVTAFYLAQEAVEYVRNIRDGNGLSVTPLTGWLDGLNECTGNNYCGIDPSNREPPSRIIACDHLSNNDGCQLVFDSSLKIYRAMVGGETASSLFRRELQIRPVGSLLPNDAADIISTVTWQVGSITKTLVINARIFNWYQSS